MTKNPVLNAALAALYIAGVVLFIFSLGNFENSPDVPEILLPLTMISLLVLSVLVMSALFFLQPVQLYLDGKKKEAVALFVRSIGAFAVIVVALLGTVVYLVQ